MSAFAVLSADDKVVLILRDFLDLSTDDIAQLIDVAPGTVGSRLNRARGRQQLRGNRPDRGCGAPARGLAPTVRALPR